MSSFQFKNVVIESIAVNLPVTEIRSSEIEDRLSDTYKRLALPIGTIERLSGVATRYMWEPEVLPSHAAIEAVGKLFKSSRLWADQIGSLISCSITRDYFEPAVASIVHGKLALPETSITFDISNGSVGIFDGIAITASLIERGIIEAGIVVSAEVTTKMVENSIRNIQNNKNIQKDEFLKHLLTLTLGSGSVAILLCHKNLVQHGHTLKGIVARTASKFTDVGMPNGDYHGTQHTDFNTITENYLSDIKNIIGWNLDEVNHFFCNSVGKKRNEPDHKETGPECNEYSIYRKYGNLLSAALPTALSLRTSENPINDGDKVLLTGYDGELNLRYLGIEW